MPVQIHKMGNHVFLGLTVLTQSVKVNSTGNARVDLYILVDHEGRLSATKSLDYFLNSRLFLVVLITEIQGFNINKLPSI